MVKPASTDKFLAATGIAWPDWIARLDAQNARDLPHPRIAELIVESGKASSWWAQSITVAYEQHIGRRLPGQRADGRFNASISRTLDGEAEALFARWCEMMRSETEILGYKLRVQPTVSKTAMGHNWRCRTEDGAYVVTTFSPAAAKTRLALQHEGLETFEMIAEAKAYWRDKLDGI